MPAARLKVQASFAGAIAGLLAIVVLLLVPVFGIRKGIEHLYLDWQELALYSSCLITGVLAGGRLGFRYARQKELDAEAEKNAVEVVEEIHDDDIPIMTEPEIEMSLAGGPKKRPRFYLSKEQKARSVVLLIFLYLVLFVMCAVLCQKFQLGSIVSDPTSAEIIRNVGLGMSVLGLYLMLRGLFSTATFKVDLSRESRGDINSAGHAPHVPPSSIVFLKKHPVCSGWLVALTGLPLVFQAWFPLLAIPGIFVWMNWFFHKRASSQFN